MSNKTAQSIKPVNRRFPSRILSNSYASAVLLLIISYLGGANLEAFESPTTGTSTDDGSAVINNPTSSGLWDWDYCFANSIDDHDASVQTDANAQLTCRSPDEGTQNGWVNEGNVAFGDFQIVAQYFGHANTSTWP